jgi:hypothetical protein
MGRPLAKVTARNACNQEEDGVMAKRIFEEMMSLGYLFHTREILLCRYHLYSRVYIYYGPLVQTSVRRCWTEDGRSDTALYQSKQEGN